ncbi:MAG TPA: D-arabinono-1,4-lactone oxidase [Pseudonocardia sp.]
MSLVQEHQTWHNWAGNLSCAPTRLIQPENEVDVVDALKLANRQNLPVRVLGAGHSFSPLCVTDGVLITPARMTGVTATDATTRRAVVLPGTRIRDLGDPLWAAGLCLNNQGDIDTQQIVGAISTATHGSGKKLKSFAGAPVRFRVVLPSGEPIEITDADKDLMGAMRVSLGLLGVITEVELQVRDTFGLAERLEFWTLDEVLGSWDENFEQLRHFSFFYHPHSESPDRLFMPHPEGRSAEDMSMVKRYYEHPADDLDKADAIVREAGYQRFDRPYRIYPDPDFQGDIVMRELEYMIPFERGRDAFLALRRLIREDFPENRFPIEVRSIAADDAWLSGFSDQDSISISICGHEQLDYRRFLAAVSDVLDPFAGRPHWGKIFYQDRERMRELFPRFDDFVRMRRELDPTNMFLSPELAPLFA